MAKEPILLSNEIAPTPALVRAECRTQIEGAKEGLRAAQEGLDRAILDEAKARQAYIDWLNYLNARPDKGSAVTPMQGSNLIYDVAELTEAKGNEFARPRGAVAAGCPCLGVCRFGGGVD
jgi:hypothetical protein